MAHKVTFKYPAGIELMCKITGFQGIVISRIEMLNGALQYQLQPKSQKDYMPEGYSIDEDSLEVPKADGIKTVTYKPETVDFDFRPGDKVKSKITGFTGIVNMAILHINKCQQYSVKGCGLLDKDHKPITHPMPSIEMEKINSGLHAGEKKQATKEPQKRTGGASQRMSMCESIPTGRE